MKFWDTYKTIGIMEEWKSGMHTVGLLHFEGATPKLIVDSETTDPQ